MASVRELLTDDEERADDCLAMGHREPREHAPGHWTCEHCDAEWFGNEDGETDEELDRG